MKRKSMLVAHLLLLALVVVILLPGRKQVEPAEPFLAALAVIELTFLLQYARKRRAGHYADLLILIWCLLLLWEILVSKLDLLHPVLCPAPENVFQVFAQQYPVLLQGIFSSLQLLALGVLLGIGLGLVCGLIAGWLPRLRALFYPLAQVVAPIPPIVYAPYLIALMPSFRSASALVIFLGIFWPTFLNMIIRVGAIERQILDSARALALSNRTMIFAILLPYVLPSVVSGLKVTLTTSIMLLIFAEMMGATSGMGYYIINYTHYANYTNVVAGIILVGIVVTALNWLVSKIQANAIQWR